MLLKSLIAGGVGVLMFMLHQSLNWAQSSDERIRQLEQDLSRMRQDVEALKKESAKPYKFPIDFGATVTVRYDVTSIEDKLDLRYDDRRDGFRTRDRFWAEYTPDGPVNAGVRLSTGETPNPTSPFVRFGDLFRSKSFNLDQFWIAVRPIQFFDARPRDSLPAAVALYSYNRLNAGLVAPSFNPVAGGEAGQGTAAILLRDPGLQRTNNQINFNVPTAVGFVSNTFNVLNFTAQLHYPLPVLVAL